MDQSRTALGGRLAMQPLQSWYQLFWH